MFTQLSSLALAKIREPPRTKLDPGTFQLVLANSFRRVGDGEIRTLDPLLARQVLSQLSYTPTDAGLPSF